MRAIAAASLGVVVCALLFALAPKLAQPAAAAAIGVFDHTHTQWDALLRKHVVVRADGKASSVDYRGLLADHAALQTYLSSLSAVTPADYASWSRAEQFAFLANAYNAFSVELILSRYPDLHSIRDLGNFLQSPWRKRFFTLLGQPQHLDGVEHELVRAPGVFDEPRVHVALNCASRSCPMLSDRAFTAATLDAQLEDL
jgi:hypothetical protein